MSISCLFPHFNSKVYKLTCEVTKCIRQKHINFIGRRYLSQKLHDKNSSYTFIPFKQVIFERRLQANRSILVQVQSAQSYKELYLYCNSVGTVKEIFHYSVGVEPLHFIIVEFNNEADVANVLSKSAHINDNQIVPVQSSFLWFKLLSRKASKQKIPKTTKLQLENGTRIPDESEIKNLLQQEQNISDQINFLYNTTKLNDVGTRLRFMVAHQIESALSGIFPHMVAYPFGSSVNGFGKMGCDLDIVLKLYERSSVVNDDSRLVFHSKAVTGSERSTSQRHMETMGDLLHLFLPGCTQVRRILQARVPIIKFYHQLTDVECDLSMSNLSGVHMSDLLYIMGEFDSRVRPLVFTVKKWASETGVTNFYPGRWITNFSLTLMVLAFLQKPNHGPPVLPPLNALVKAAEQEDKIVTEEGVNCTFLRNINKLGFDRKNIDSVHSLLQQFFEHYLKFDYSAKAICLSNSSPITKPDHSPLYIVNPMERGLNVSKNVSLDELERLQTEMRNAVWLLESQEGKTSNWGILSIFEKKKPVARHKQNKLVQVSKLFEEDTDKLTVNFKNK